MGGDCEGCPELPQTVEPTKYLTPRQRVDKMLPFCPVCGFGVKYDEDGCCNGCGATILECHGPNRRECAVGFEALVSLVESIAKDAVEHERADLNERVSKSEARITDALNDIQDALDNIRAVLPKAK
jgi:predicted nucleic acid-binding Zn ribbon protein